jgi:hypothetical protein
MHWPTTPATHCHRNAPLAVYIVPRTGLAQTCKRTEMLQKPPLRATDQLSRRLLHDWAPPTPHLLYMVSWHRSNVSGPACRSLPPASDVDPDAPPYRVPCEWPRQLRGSRHVPWRECASQGRGRGRKRCSNPPRKNIYQSNRWRLNFAAAPPQLFTLLVSICFRTP